MTKPEYIFITAVFFILTVFAVSCESADKPASRDDTEPVSNHSDESPYLGAETLSKRLVLYRTAMQENELASITAMADSYEDIEVPELARMLNETWWSIDWEGAHLNPLAPAEITALETEIFPLIAVEMLDSDDVNGWAQFVLSFDARIVKRLIAQAHDEWQQEQLDLFISSYIDDCMQVWCVKIGGEWKILAHFDCGPDVEVPLIPVPPDDLFETEISETETDTEIELDEAGNPVETE